VRAELEGRPIPVREIPNHYCEDSRFPLITCFRTAAALEAAIRAESAAGSEGDLDSTAEGMAITSLATGNYVIVYSSTSWLGSYMYISQDYDALALVGWNDRIRSYRGLNSGLGSFWTDWYGTGAGFNFCCNQQQASLSSTFDRAISSVYRR
jgi:hypothetical protein